MTILGVLDELKPEKVFKYFEQLTQIPHGSYNCKAISDFCVEFAKERGLYVKQDEYYNIIIKKEASPSCVNKPTLILQGHLDMVCQKEEGCKIDFAKDGLDLEINGDFIKARGTTLGGDDGIAVAYALAILDDDTIIHPALEVVFTTEEEVGMEGAMGFDASELEGRYLINIDSEDEGILLSACAGGTTIKAEFPLEYKDVSGDFYQIDITGLLGGHSGTEIDKNHGNAHKMMGEFLSKAEDIKVSKIWGAKEQKDNAIPYECHCIFMTEDAKNAAQVKETLENEWKIRYQNSEPHLCVKLEKMEKSKGKVLTTKANEGVIKFLVEVKNGIYTMSQDIEGLVESSLNFGILRMNEDFMTCSFGVRSSVPIYKEELAQSIELLTKSLGGIYTRSNDYPAWEYRSKSPLREAFCKAYKELYKEDIKVEAIHAGLECGIFASKIQDVDIVSFGPDILDIHTVKERMSISSVKRTWELLLKVIEEFP